LVVKTCCAIPLLTTLVISFFYTAAIMRHGETSLPSSQLFLIFKYLIINLAFYYADMHAADTAFL
jgi:hypothetical protein